MRLAPYHNYRRWLQKAGFFIMGAVVGSMLFLTVYQHNFNEIVIMNHTLEMDKLKLQDDNNLLLKYKDKQSLIKNITIQLLSDPNELPLNKVTENELKKRLQRDWKYFIGKSVKSISLNPDIPQMIGRRVYLLVNERDYLVEIRTLIVIQTELQIWFTAKEFKRD